MHRNQNPSLPHATLSGLQVIIVSSKTIYALSMASMEQKMGDSSAVFICADVDLTYRMTDDDGLTTTASCEVVGPKDRRRITIPPTRIVTLRCRPLINSIVGDGGERNPASEIPVPSGIFQPTGNPNLTQFST